VSLMKTNQNYTSIDELIHGRNSALWPLHGYSVPFTGRRLNLVVDSLNDERLIRGGTAAIILSTLLATRWQCELRIISRLEKANKQNFNLILNSNGIIALKNAEFLFSPLSNPKAEIPVGDGDVFLTTSWWNTKSVQEIFGERKIIYLVQEDERKLYPYGDDHLQCTRILSNTSLQFVIDTKLLYDQLNLDGMEGIRRNGLWFEPSTSSKDFYYEDHKSRPKKRFFFHANQNNPSHLFYLGLEVINEAVLEGILNLDEWDLHFVGTDVQNICIGNSYVPHVYPNINLYDYGSLIRTADLSLCLMYSAHPGYPTLDLASSGAVVITNRFENKQFLGDYSENILCYNLDVKSMVQGVREGCSLASNAVIRLQNYQKNGILRDWQTSLEKILVRLSE
jgi:WsaF, C-terminal domain/WsaF, N-terminal domain